MPVRTFAALVALSKREPGKLTYGTAGAGSPGNLIVRMIEEASNGRFLQVPYKGIGQAVQGLLRGETAFMVSDIGSVLPHVRSGKVLALAVTTRTPHLPATPTLAEAGYPKIQTYVSFMVVAPAGTRPAIVQRLGAEIINTMKSPKFRERLDALGYVPAFDTPDEFAASLKKERQMWADVIRRNNITAE
jgi:tripartite-type tricarboxylate transporter receptor subunit TctC